MSHVRDDCFAIGDLTVSNTADMAGLTDLFNPSCADVTADAKGSPPYNDVSASSDVLSIDPAAASFAAAATLSTGTGAEPAYCEVDPRSSSLSVKLSPQSRSIA
jgi:hypothetical protein